GLEEFFQGQEVFGGAAFGDLVDLGLGAVDDFGDVLAVGARVAVLDDAGARFDQAAQDRLLRDDLGVEAGVGRGGDGLGQGDQLGGAADAPELAAAFEARGGGDRVGGFAAAVEVEDGVVDGLVRGAVEV